MSQSFKKQDSISQEIKILEGNLRSLEIEFNQANRLPTSEEKETKQLEIVSKIFDLVPSLKSDFTQEQFYKTNGHHSSNLKSKALMYGMKEFYEEHNSSTVNLDSLDSLSDSIIETEISIETGKGKTISLDNDEEITIPQFAKEKVFIIKDKQAFLDTLQKTLAEALSSQTENMQSKIESISQSAVNDAISNSTINNTNSEIDSNQIKWTIANLLKEVLSNQKVEVASPDGTTAVILNLPRSIDSHQINSHFVKLAQNLLSDFTQINGIVETRTPFEVVKKVTLPDGTKATQNVIENRIVRNPSLNASSFARTLLTNNIKNDETGQPVNLYEMWFNKLQKEVIAKTIEWINSGSVDISQENDSKFYNLFLSSVDKVNDDLKSIDPNQTPVAWEYNVPANSFIQKPSRTNELHEAIEGAMQPKYNYSTPSPQFNQTNPVLPQATQQSSTTNYQVQQPQLASNSQPLVTEEDIKAQEAMDFISSYANATSYY